MRGEEGKAQDLCIHALMLQVRFFCKNLFSLFFALAGSGFKSSICREWRREEKKNRKVEIEEHVYVDARKWISRNKKTWEFSYLEEYKQEEEEEKLAIKKQEKKSTI